MQKMSSIGVFLDSFGQLEVLESIDENIILADSELNVQWANPRGALFLRKIANLYGMEDERDFLGRNMNQFHRRPERQERIINTMDVAHKAVIQFKNVYSAEIIVNPIKDKNHVNVGYSILLMDVTDKIKEQKEQGKLIQELSVPILKIWDGVLGVSLKGALDDERYAILTDQLMSESVRQQARYILLDLGGIGVDNEGMVSQLNHLQAALKLIGAEPITVGISPKLAVLLSKQNIDWKTFGHAEQGIRYILKKENLEIVKA